MNKDTKTSSWQDAFGTQIPGLGNPLAGGMDFMRNLWGNLPSGIPGFVVPTADLGELDKRIKDLKTVESWLDMNLSILRTSIQSLEVQRNTVAAIQSIGAQGGLLSEILKATVPGHAARSAQEAAVPPRDPHLPAGWPVHASPPVQAAPVPPPAPVAAPAARPAAVFNPFAALNAIAAANAPAPARAAKPASEPEDGGEDEESAPEDMPPDLGARVAGAAAHASAAPADNAQAADAESSVDVALPPGFSPNAWINFMQGQFHRVAQSAINTTPPGMPQMMMPPGATAQSATKGTARATKAGKSASPAVNTASADEVKLPTAKKAPRKRASEE